MRVNWDVIRDDVLSIFTLTSDKNAKNPAPHTRIFYSNVFPFEPIKSTLTFDYWGPLLIEALIARAHESDKSSRNLQELHLVIF